MLKKKIALLTLGLGLAGNTAAFTLDGDMRDVLVDGLGPDLHYSDELVQTSNLQPGVVMKAEKYNDVGGGYTWDHMVMYMALDGDNLYVSVFTGAPPDLDTTDGDPNAAVGDLAIRAGEAANLDDWQMSSVSGGGYQAGSDFYGIEIPNANTPTASTTDVLQQPTWDDYNSTPTSITGGGTDTGDAQVVYTSAKYYGGAANAWNYNSANWEQAWFMEAFIPLASLGYNANDNVIQVAAWLSFNCSNDEIFLSHTFNRPSGGNPPPGVPEPAPLAIMAIGMVGMGFARKRARRK